MIDEVGKNYSFQPGKKVAKSGVIAAGKMLKKIFSKMEHFQTLSKRETSSSIGVKFILSFKTFLRSSLKIKTSFLYFIALLLEK